MYVVALTGGADAQTFDATYTISTTAYKDGVIMEDVFQAGGSTFSTTFQCEGEGAWPLVRGEMTVSSAGKERRAAFSRVGSEIKVTSNGRTDSAAFPIGTVLEASLFRIVPQLPETEGRVYTFPAFAETMQLHAIEPGNGQDFTITCKGNESVKINGATFHCVRYDISADSTLSFFVDDTDRVRYVTNSNGSTMRLVDNRTAAVNTD